MKNGNSKESRLDMYVFISVELGKLVLEVQEKYGISESVARRCIGKIVGIMNSK